MIEKLKEGKYWFGFLILLNTIVVVIYIIAHFFLPGNEMKTLNNSQFQNLTLLVDDFDNPSDSIEQLNRPIRDKRIISYLKTSFDEDSIVTLNRIFVSLPDVKTKNVMSLLKDQEYKVSSFFWLHGYESFAEVLSWALVGVLLSLIYYVSIANRGKPADGSTTLEVRAFDYKEIYDHIAKMVYAPVCTLVLILSYTYISSDNSVANVSAGKGMLVFSFISGFYSGRVMKFLDKLKDLLLPSSGGDATITSNSAKTNHLQETETRFAINTTSIGNQEDIDYSKLKLTLVSPSNHVVHTEWYENTETYNTNMKMEDGVYTVHAELLNNTNDVVRKFNASPLDIQQHKSEYTISLTN
jgi:hypothetical protein